MKCNKCGNNVVQFPIKDENGKIIWKNLFKMNLVSLLFLVSILFLIFAYIHDTEACRTINEAPCTYCKDMGCCNLVYEDGFFSDPTIQTNNETPSFIKWGDDVSTK